MTRTFTPFPRIRWHIAAIHTLHGHRFFAPLPFPPLFSAGAAKSVGRKLKKLKFWLFAEQGSTFTRTRRDAIDELVDPTAELAEVDALLREEDGQEQGQGLVDHAEAEAAAQAEAEADADAEFDA